MCFEGRRIIRQAHRKIHYQVFRKFQDFLKLREDFFNAFFDGEMGVAWTALVSKE